MLAIMSRAASWHGLGTPITMRRDRGPLPAHDGPQAVPGYGHNSRRGIGLRPIIGGTPMPRAFTLVEMLVVVAIIAILMGAMLAIGSYVRTGATRRSTLLQLHLLSRIMDDYLSAGNPEPPVPSPWPYASSAPDQYAPTAPASDPINWVLAFKSDSKYRAKLDSQNRQTTTDAGVPKAGVATTFSLILDSYGNPIRYVPSSGGKAGYFMSAGPDGKFSTVTPAPNPPYRPDDIYSTDTQ